ncbi:MAG TPA: DUF1552 domain-containing protein [Pirellulaceae bacterium]|nr:DUF1552 domain-containing protein [Pirellulaceae bacterium]
MAAKQWSISRRTMLRGAGVTLGLPLLDAMLPRTARAASAKPPVRMAALYFPNGVWQDAWIPKETGENYTLPFSLEPLAPVKDRVLVFSGLDKKHSREGDGHYAKTANFLTGLKVRKTTGKEISSGGISMDQYAAQQIGHHTPLPSLELAIDPVISGIDSNVGYTRLYGSYISWQAENRPVAKEIQPRLVYERLFGARTASSDAAAAQKLADQRSLLDLTLDDAKRLRGKLGRDDQFKLDEYVDSIRAVEKRIEFFARPDDRAWKPTLAPVPAAPADKAPHDFREHIRIMLDLMVLAFQTDATRVSSFMFANDVSGRNFSFVDGVRGSHHELSHHENNKEKLEQYQRINRWHVEQFVYMLEKMKAIPEGESTLLDNSMVLLGCGMSDGNRHDPNNLPILLGGRAGGSLPSGRHLKSDANTPLCNLYVSMLERLGAPVMEFGDSTGPLQGLTTAS